MRRKGSVKKLGVVLLLLLVSGSVTALEVKPKQNPRTGLLSWSIDEAELSLELVQLLPDFVAAVFSSRELPPRVIDTLKEYCVFGTIIKNKTAGTLAYRVSDWRFVTPDGREHKIKTKTEWSRQWADMGTPFHWLFLPDDQNFGVGDWSQGFTTIKLPPDSAFSLKFSWRYQGETRQRTLENLRCAPATLPTLPNAR